MTRGCGRGLSPFSGRAHDEHCHTKDATGNLVDAKDLKDKKSCEAKGGTWFHHHAHCHKADATGKPLDVADAKTEKDCTAKGGSWTDHGHDADDDDHKKPADKAPDAGPAKK